MANFPGLKELVSNPGKETEQGKKISLQKQPEQISEFYSKLKLYMKQGAPATITFTRDARVGEDAIEEAVDVDQAWSREDIEGMFKERIEGFEILAKTSGATKTEL